MNDFQNSFFQLEHSCGISYGSGQCSPSLGSERGPPLPPRPDTQEVTSGGDHEIEATNVNSQSHTNIIQDDTLLVRGKSPESLTNGYAEIDSDHINKGYDTMYENIKSSPPQPTIKSPKNKSIKGKQTMFKCSKKNSSIEEALPQTIEKLLVNDTYVESSIPVQNGMSQSQNGIDRNSNQMSQSHQNVHRILENVINGNMLQSEDGNLEINLDDSRLFDRSEISEFERPNLTRRSTETEISAAYCVPKPGKIQIPEVFKKA